MSAVASRVSEIHLKEPQSQVNPTLSLLLAEVPPLESIAKAFISSPSQSMSQKPLHPLPAEDVAKAFTPFPSRGMSQKPLHPLPREGEGRGEGG